jgi:four helix bundle protein
MASTYRELIVWQKAMRLVTLVYEATRAFPKEEIYALTSQVRRCAVSIPSNIAEGNGRKSRTDYVRFLQISVGSLYELETQVEIAKNLGYLTAQVFDGLTLFMREIERMLSSLVRKLST